jgi:hypothetical protein
LLFLIKESDDPIKVTSLPYFRTSATFQFPSIGCFLIQAEDGRSFGKRLGMKNFDLEPATILVPLVWRNCQQLADDLNQTPHIEGVIAVLEVPIYFVDKTQCDSYVAQPLTTTSLW